MGWKNPEDARAYHRRWRKENKEAYLASQREYHAKNRESINARARERRLQHPERQRANQHKYLHGITAEQVAEKLANQDGLCAICRKFEHPLCLDHCHSSGMVRGLLCDDCNVALGRMKDSVANLQNAIAYLQYHHDDGD